MNIDIVKSFTKFIEVNKFITDNAIDIIFDTFKNNIPTVQIKLYNNKLNILINTNLYKKQRNIININYNDNLYNHINIKISMVDNNIETIKSSIKIKGIDNSYKLNTFNNETKCICSSIYSINSNIKYRVIALMDSKYNINRINNHISIGIYTHI